ncbi:golgin subfamily A member 6-like protein 22 [Oncorhynchus mykiss]|uniref:golgin subfamily A member 6-like protein 22 n=1 Tax=Oncorhynchus mykiss TaxID=8022 RepID=UPI0018776A10|nr:golgin subfamily A member 6-like protein 22 [Oncorhynchus mykiss]
MTLWEEREEKVAEQRRLQEQQEQRQKPQAKRAAVVNWWRTLKVEGGRTKVKPEDTLTQPSKTLTDTDSKLQQAKHTITKIREQVCHLESALRTAQEDVAEHKYIQDRVGVLHKDKKTNTVREGPGWTGEEASKERKDVAVATDHVEDPGRSEKVAAQLVTSEGLLVTLRRMEAMVSIALEAAELVRESQRRVSQVKERMESITQKMEEALTRAANTEDQLSALEARVTAKPQLPGPIGQTAQPGVEAIGRDRPRNPSPPEPMTESYSKSRWPLISGMMRLRLLKYRANTAFVCH